MLDLFTVTLYVGKENIDTKSYKILQVTWQFGSWLTNKTNKATCNWSQKEAIYIYIPNKKREKNMGLSW